MHALLILGAGLLIAADANPFQKDKARLEGTWDLVSSTEDGNKPTKPGFGTALTLGEDKFVIHILPKSGSADNPGTSIEWSYSIDPARKPAALDLRPLSGLDKGKTIRAIYFIDKDHLKICRATLPDKDRPTEFVSQRGTLLQTFKKR